MSKRLDILDVVLTRLQAIRQVGGFATDAGTSVSLGEAPELGPDDPNEAIAIVPRDDMPTSRQGKKLFIEWPIAVCALAKADLEEPWVSIEAIVADIKSAIELDDMTLGGLLSAPMARGATRVLDREPGSLTVGASVTYVLSTQETWGAP